MRRHNPTSSEAISGNISMEQGGGCWASIRRSCPRACSGETCEEPQGGARELVDAMRWPPFSAPALRASRAPGAGRCQDGVSAYFSSN